MATVYIDGEAHEVDPSRNMLDVCLTLGFDLPYFCWHPAMGSVGACRQCAVKQYQDEEDEQGKIVMACMTPAADGTRISIRDPEAAAFRASVIEWLMVNHPHDCPVCDEGGECHLQDMTVMTGHIYRSFRFDKRTYRNQYLGPFINHEMNRCIHCYRCVRFYRQIAGGRDLDVFGAHDHVYFGRHEDGVLQSEFSGNLVEVCPTGVFTDKSLMRHYTRKWDLQTAPSLCVHCSLGCNTLPGERYGQLRRIHNRYNGEVNGYFLCDRGRYGYDFVNSEERILEPRRRDADGDLHVISAEEALDAAAGILAQGQVVAIGSPRASLESNFALWNLVGGEAFYGATPSYDRTLANLALEILTRGPARTPSLQAVATADAALVLGEDLTNTAPMLDLALKQTVRQAPMALPRELGIAAWDDAAVREVIQGQTGPLYLLTPGPTKLDDFATATYRGAPQDLARLGFAVAHILDHEAPNLPDLDPAMGELAEEIAAALREAARPVVVAGPSLGSEDVLRAAANVAWALRRRGVPAEICLTAPEANSMGLAMMEPGDLAQALERLESGEANTLLLLECDLHRCATPSTAEAILGAAEHVILLDHTHTETAERAHLTLPVPTYAESNGTLVNNECRAQRFYQVFGKGDHVRESWRWLDALRTAREPRQDGRETSLASLRSSLVAAFPVFAALGEAEAQPGRRQVQGKIPRQPHRYSGRTAMRANLDVHEPKPPEDEDTPLAFSMEGYSGKPPADLIPRYWSPGWNSVQALNKFQAEVGGPLRGGDPGIRLIEPSKSTTWSYYEQIPDAFKPRPDQLLALPRYHIFGSEPLSAKAPGIAELSPDPYLALGPAEAESRGLEEGSRVRVWDHGRDSVLALRTVDSLPEGVALIPFGLSELPYGRPPAWVRVEREERAKSDA